MADAKAVLDILEEHLLHGFDKGANGGQVISTARKEALELLMKLEAAGYVVIPRR